MMNSNNIWLSIEQVCKLTNSQRETIRRKCKSGEYKTRFEIQGRKKNYEILLSSLPIKYIHKYNSYLQPVAVEEKSIEDFSSFSFLYNEFNSCSIFKRILSSSSFVQFEET